MREGGPSAADWFVFSAICISIVGTAAFDLKKLAECHQFKITVSGLLCRQFLYINQNLDLFEFANCLSVRSYPHLKKKW